MISVVLPAFNEEQGIGSTIETLLRVFAQAELDGSQIIVVDDGSSDRTGEIARSAGAMVIRHPHNAGYGRSLKDGILAARHDTLVIADADGTYPLEQVPALLAEYAKGFDMVVGARSRITYRESMVKRPLRAILKLLVEFTTGRRVPDVNSGLRVFSRASMLPAVRHLSDGFSFTTSLTLAYMMTGRFVAYVPIDYHRRIGSTKVRLVRDSLRTLQFIVQAILYYNPLKIFLLLALLSLLMAGLCFAAAAAFHLTSAFLLGVGAVLVAMLTFCMGLLAVLLRQILDK